MHPWLETIGDVSFCLRLYPHRRHLQSLAEAPEKFVVRLFTFLNLTVNAGLEAVLRHVRFGWANQWKLLRSCRTFGAERVECKTQDHVQRPLESFDRRVLIVITTFGSHHRDNRVTHADLQSGTHEKTGVVTVAWSTLWSI